MKTNKILLIMSVLFSSTAIANETCDILAQGNKHYSSKKYKKALNTYEMVEEIDKIGKEPCTDSIYATIATIYTKFGDKNLKTNSFKAAIYYKKASKYNRAFAYATACSNNKSCKGSKSFWNVK